MWGGLSTIRPPLFLLTYFYRYTKWSSVSFRWSPFDLSLSCTRRTCWKNTYLDLVLDNKYCPNLFFFKSISGSILHAVNLLRYILGITPSSPEFLMGTNQIWSVDNLIKACHQNVRHWSKYLRRAILFSPLASSKLIKICDISH